MMETTRCRLEHLKETDYENMKSIYTNKEVRKYLGGTIPEEHLLNKFLEALARSHTKESLLWTVRLKENNKFIGVISLDDHTDGNHKEVSYEFLPESWGNGYAAEVLSQLILYALNELQLSKVIAETQTANVSSCRLLEKLGMKLEGTLQRYGSEQALYGIEHHS